MATNAAKQESRRLVGRVSFQISPWRFLSLHTNFFRRCSLGLGLMMRPLSVVECRLSPVPAAHGPVPCA
eukprot:5990777-Prymnesium_polylepis.1